VSIEAKPDRVIVFPAGNKKKIERGGQKKRKEKAAEKKGFGEEAGKGRKGKSNSGRVQLSAKGSAGGAMLTLSGERGRKVGEGVDEYA
jgi:hypothetical protein